MSWLFTLVNPIIVRLAGSFLHRLVSHQVVVLGFTAGVVAGTLRYR